MRQSELIETMERMMKSPPTPAKEWVNLLEKQPGAIPDHFEKELRKAESEERQLETFYERQRYDRGLLVFTLKWAMVPLLGLALTFLIPSFHFVDDPTIRLDLPVLSNILNFAIGVGRVVGVGALIAWVDREKIWKHRRRYYDATFAKQEEKIRVKALINTRETRRTQIEFLRKLKDDEEFRKGFLEELKDIKGAT